MTTIQPLRHGEISLTRKIKASKNTCFQAWTEIEHKKNWFVVPSTWKLIERKIDFREGGEEILHGGNDNFQSKYVAKFHRIIPNEQLVYAFDMYVNSGHYSISLTGVDFVESNNITELIYVEKIFYLTEDYDEHGRYKGTEQLLDNYLAYVS